MKNLAQAIRFAQLAHEGQVRKFNSEPYINHPVRVMNAVVMDKEWGGIERIAMAAVLHDVVEDTDETLDSLQLYGDLGMDVKRYVDELTNKFTKEDYPDLNRRARKAKEFERLSRVTDAAKTIKLYDRIDNLESWFDIPGHGLYPEDRWTPDQKGFGRVYAQESWDLMVALAQPEFAHITVHLGELAARLREGCAS
jgi:(p)ppGpp synthase/HD superfamily hydrolase